MVLMQEFPLHPHGEIRILCLIAGILYQGTKFLFWYGMFSN